jgi:uncharacterized protein (TIGR02594 family)
LVGSLHLTAAGKSATLWYRIAMREIETRVDEIVGPADNPRIVEYHQSTSLKVTDDETPWCSSFLNWIMEQAAQPKTDSAMARSWLNWGKEIEKPKKGCVVIFSRGNNPASGHAGLFVSEENDRLLILGGDQGNQVCISSYPKSRVLGYRWPSPPALIFPRCCS